MNSMIKHMDYELSGSSFDELSEVLGGDDAEAKDVWRKALQDVFPNAEIFVSRRRGSVDCDRMRAEGDGVVAIVEGSSFSVTLQGKPRFDWSDRLKEQLVHAWDRAWQRAARGE